jgi:mono/diheme cytochrome c family protein
MKAPWIAAALLVASGIVASPTLAQSSPAKAGNAANGKKLFIADGCYECHGREGQGGSAAPIGSYGPRLAPPKLSVDAIRLYVRHPNGGMPPFTAKVLSDADIADIYAFLKTIQAPPPVKDIPLLNH